MNRIFSVALTGCFALASAGLLIAQETGEAVADAVVVAEAEPAATLSSARPLTASVALFSKTTIAGTLVDNAQISIKTAFGAVNVPMSEVAGVRFADSEDPTTTIVMLNGDSVTGATDVKEVVVDTEWGTAKINGSSVQSIMLVPDLRWNATQGISGRRWNLVEIKAENPTQPTQGATTQGVQPRRGVLQSDGTIRYSN